MNSIKKNFIYNLIYQVLIVLFPLVTSPYISRVLGSDGLGVYSYRYSIANYFVIFAMLGISTHGNRSVAMVRDDREKVSQTFWNIYVAHLIISVSITVIYLFYVLKMVDVNRDIAMIEMVYVVSAIFDINWFFFGIERFDLTVTRNIVVKVLSVTSIFVFVHERTDVWKYALIMSLGTLISQSFVWIYLKKYVDFRKPTLKGIIAQIKPMLVLFLPVIAISVYKLMDKIMLGAMTTMSEVGVYENAEKINSLTSGIITALGTVMLPRMTNLAANGKKNESKKYINISIQFVSLLAAAIAFGINSGAYVSEIIRAGIQSIDQGQTEAARSLGLSQTMNLRYIILPQALKNILPAIANEFVVIIKESAITYTIGVQDIMSAVNAVKGATFIIIEPLLVATAIYFCLCFPTSKLIAYFERRMSHGDKR